MTWTHWTDFMLAGRKIGKKPTKRKRNWEIIIILLFFLTVPSNLIKGLKHCQESIIRLHCCVVRRQPNTATHNDIEERKKKANRANIHSICFIEVLFSAVKVNCLFFQTFKIKYWFYAFLTLRRPHERTTFSCTILLHLEYLAEVWKSARFFENLRLRFQHDVFYLFKVLH